MHWTSLDLLLVCLSKVGYPSLAPLCLFTRILSVIKQNPVDRKRTRIVPLDKCLFFNGQGNDSFLLADCDSLLMV